MNTLTSWGCLKLKTKNLNDVINPFLATDPILYLLSGVSRAFSGVFREYKTRTLARNGLTSNKSRVIFRNFSVFVDNFEHISWWERNFRYCRHTSRTFIKQECKLWKGNKSVTRINSNNVKQRKKSNVNPYISLFYFYPQNTYAR